MSASVLTRRTSYVEQDANPCRAACNLKNPTYSTVPPAVVPSSEDYRPFSSWFVIMGSGIFITVIVHFLEQNKYCNFEAQMHARFILVPVL